MSKDNVDERQRPLHALFADECMQTQASIQLKSTSMRSFHRHPCQASINKSNGGTLACMSISELEPPCAASGNFNELYDMRCKHKLSASAVPRWARA